MKHDSHDDRVVILFVKGYFGFTKPQLEAMIRMKNGKWHVTFFIALFDSSTASR